MIKGLIKYLILIAIFSAGITLGYFFWDKITLPFKNPWNVIGPLTIIKYNPSNDIIRFVVFLLSPIVILFLVCLLNIKKIKNIFFDSEDSKNINRDLSVNLPLSRKKIFAVILIISSIILAINFPTYYSSGRFDTFHEGESLGAGVSYIHGKILYKDFIFVHGIYQDPLRTAAAFRLFGRSIGSVRTLESIVKVFVFILLCFFLIRIYQGNYLCSSVSILIILVLLIWRITYKYLLIPVILVASRDITTFSFLIAVTFLQDFINKNQNQADAKRLFIINLFFSFIPLASFSYSIDRGFYLFATYLILCPILYIIFFHKSVFRYYYLISTFLGLLSAVALMGTLLHGSFAEFFRYTFLIMPRYKELLDGYIYLINNPFFLGICILIAANSYWVAFQFIKEFHLNNWEIKLSLKSFMEKYLTELCLLLISILFFRSALGRSDWSHVAYVSIFTYILSIYIVIKYLFHNLLSQYSFKKIFDYALASIIILLSIFGIYRIYSKNLITENFPLKIEDSHFIPKNYISAISFLKNNLNREEGFFTMTSEGSWYYFIDKPCPTRFSVIWIAAPDFYQREVVEDLKKSNVKFILYRNHHWANSIDGFSNEIRLPIVVEYIVQNYIFFKMIDDNEIWIKKTFYNIENDETHNKLGFIRARQGKLKAALFHFQEALKINPDHEESHIGLGIILAHQGDFWEALYHYREALRINPTNKSTHNNIGIVLVRQGRLDEAVFHFKEALRYDPNYSNAKNNLKFVLKLINKSR